MSGAYLSDESLDMMSFAAAALHRVSNAGKSMMPVVIIQHCCMKAIVTDGCIISTFTDVPKCMLSVVFDADECMMLNVTDADECIMPTPIDPNKCMLPVDNAADECPNHAADCQWMRRQAEHMLS